jgi:hypothetical protein
LSSDSLTEQCRRDRSTKSWYAALERAAIQDFRCRRNTWASWHVQNGTPLYALQEMGGWASTEMVRRYAHLAADHLAPFAERLCALRAVNSEVIGTKVTARKLKGPASLQALENLVAGARNLNYLRVR